MQTTTTRSRRNDMGKKRQTSSKSDEWNDKQELLFVLKLSTICNAKLCCNTKNLDGKQQKKQEKR